MASRSRRTAAVLLTVLCATAGLVEGYQLQNNYLEVPEVVNTTEVANVTEHEIPEELQPLVAKFESWMNSRLESQLEAINTKLALLESQVVLLNSRVEYGEGGIRIKVTQAPNTTLLHDTFYIKFSVIRNYRDT